MTHSTHSQFRTSATAGSANLSRRRFCQGMVASSTALAFGQSLGYANSATSLCSGISPETAFSSSFVNVAEQYGPTRVQFDSPLPEGLSGILYRNGPARMQRGDMRWNHWFDGDGMVHAFSLQNGELVHRARMVATDRSKAEEEAGRFLWGGFGTGWEDSLPVSSTDDVNVANTSVLPVGSEVLALWEAGSPYRMHAETLETIGRLVLSPETDGLPFSAHPRVDPKGRIWNFGYLSGTGKLVLYDMNSNGKLNRTGIIEVPNADMVHDFAITEDYLVFMLQPLQFTPVTSPRASFRDSLKWNADGAVEVVVVSKQSLAVIQQFQLPAFFAFHLGNAWQDGETVRVEVATSASFDPLMDSIELATQGKRSTSWENDTQAVEVQIDLAKKRVSMESLPTVGVDFPRYDQRFTGQRTNHLHMLSSSSNMPDGVFGFDTISSLDRAKGAEKTFNYDANTLAEEHIFVAAPGGAEGEGWLIGTSYNWQQCRTKFSVFNALNVDDGPIAQAQLPYGLPLGLHGQFVAT